MLLMYSGSLLMEIGKIFSLDCKGVHVLKVGQKVSLISDAIYLQKQKKPLKGLKASDANVVKY